ncbi:MAG: hypothetical protein RL235_75 [Chlamydiota bacterium]
MERERLVPALWKGKQVFTLPVEYKGVVLDNLDFVHFSVQFSQSFDLQWVTDVCNGLFKPIADISNPLQVKILQNSHPKNVQSRDNTYPPS